MIRRLGGLALLAGLAAMVGGPAPAAPLEAYGRLPSVEDAALSPDGAHVALVLTDGAKRTVTVLDAKTRKPVANFITGNLRVGAIQWAGPDHLIVSNSSTTIVEGITGREQDWWVPLDANIRTRFMRPMIAGVLDSLNVTFGRPMVRMVDGKPVAFLEGLHFIDGVSRVSLFRFDVGSGLSTLVRDGDRDTQEWLVDGAGRPLAENRYNDTAKRWSLVLHGERGWKVFRSGVAAIEYPSMEGLGQDGKSILIEDPETEKNGEIRKVWHKIAPDAIGWPPPGVTPDGDDSILDPSSDRLIGFHSLTIDEDSYQFFDAALQKEWNAIAKAYPGDRVRFLSVSEDRKRFLIYVDSPIDGPSYALVDISTGFSDWLGGPHDGVLKDLASKRALRFPATDGLPLTGYLTTPKGVDPKSLPLVVFPHGGPAVRDEPGFDWWAQAMASRGYAVLQVNYRGSNGFGWDFMSAGFGQFGRKMQTDLSDGVRYLASKGIIDPKRVCIVGGSYGGYAALAGATLDAGVYRCAVSVAGLSDLHRFVNWDIEEAGEQSKRFWLRFLGVSDLADRKLQEISPIDQIDKVHIPILLIHGADDTVVPFEQSQIMYDALKKAGKPVELIKLKHEDHHLLAGDTRLQMLQATIAFLQKNDPP